MPNITNDLDGLIAFREHLINFNRTLQEQYTGMHGHWQNLGDAWRDAKYQEFGAALEEVARGIERYLVASEGQEAHLLHEIEALRAYLDQHV